MSEFIPEDLFVGDPEIMVRWRLQNNALPLKDRHLRALGNMGVSIALRSWARQHLEWTLAAGTIGNKDGVLTLAVDALGRALMGVEPYEPLGRLDLAGLLARVDGKVDLPVEDEVVWVVRGGSLIALTDGGKPRSGANSLIADLAATTGARPVFDAGLGPAIVRGETALAVGDEAFLVSDEHGVVGAADHAGPFGERFAGYYDRLVRSTRADDYDRANLGLL